MVHEAANQHMDFKIRNFVYVKKSFGSFINDIHQGSKQYLRSLAADKPSERPASLKSDFKELASDFVFPHQLEFVQKNAHSSPLRISGPVNIWLHYDVKYYLYSSPELTLTSIAGHGECALSNTGKQTRHNVSSRGCILSRDRPRGI